MLKIGLESGDQGVLDALDKGIILTEASMALKNLSDAGIGTYIYLLFGTPSETTSGYSRTIDCEMTPASRRRTASAFGPGGLVVMRGSIV